MQDKSKSFQWRNQLIFYDGHSFYNKDKTVKIHTGYRINKKDKLSWSIWIFYENDNSFLEDPKDALEEVYLKVLNRTNQRIETLAKQIELLSQL